MHAHFNGSLPGARATSAESDEESEELSVDLVWRCQDCGYQRQAPLVPEGCAGCGAGSERLIGKTSIAWRFLLRQSRIRPGHALSHSG